jgi:hypothetical protein
VSGQRGTAIYDTPFSPAKGLEMTFEYAAYGGTGGGGSSGPGADGLSFYLIDGAAPNNLGYGGGSGQTLGYVNAASGYVGIGLDEYGNFSDVAPLSVSCPFPPLCKRNPQSVAVRGASSKSFPVLESVSLPSKVPGLTVRTLDNRADTRTVRVTISPVTSAEPFPKVTVEIIDPNTGDFVTVIDALELTESLNGPLPATFKMAFGAGTGGYFNYHEVRIISTKTLKALPIPTLGQSTLGALMIMLALLSWPAVRGRYKN